MVNDLGWVLWNNRLSFTKGCPHSVLGCHLESQLLHTSKSIWEKMNDGPSMYVIAAYMDEPN